MNRAETQYADYFSVSFRIGGDDLDPNIITSLLEIEPDQAHKKGDPKTLKTKKGEIHNYTPYNSGLWCYTSKLDKYSRIQDHIESVLELITPKKEVLSQFRIKGYRMDFFCGHFFAGAPQPGIFIAGDVLKKLGDLGIDLDIDLYAYT